MGQRLSGAVASLARRRKSRRAAPERGQARGWDLSLLGLVLFALIIAITIGVSRYLNG
jgi:hypothetical protein